MRISPVNSKIQATQTFSASQKGNVDNQSEEKQHKSGNVKKVVIPAGLFLALVGIIAGGAHSCTRSEKPEVQGQDLIPSSYTGILNFNSNYDEISITPKDKTVDFSNPRVLADYKDKGLTLKNIIDNEYFKGEEGDKAYYQKIVSELDQSNPGVIDNVFQVATTGKYEKWQDVPFEELINVDLNEVAKEAGIRFSDLGIFSINTPKVAFEFYEEGGEKCETCKAQKTVLYLSSENELVLVNPEEKEPTAKEAKSLKDAIVKNYGVKADSYEYYYILNMIANNSKNEGLFEDYKGKVNDTNRQEILAEREGAFYVHLPQDLTLIVEGGSEETAELVNKDGVKEYYSNLLPETRKVNIKENDIKTIEDLTQFYNHPITGDSLADIDMYDETHEKYRAAIMETIILTYPEVFNGMTYEEALQADISDAESIILPDVVLNLEGDAVCDHTKQEQTQAPTTKPQDFTKPSNKPRPTPTKPDSTKPAPTKPDTTKPAPTKPDTTKPAPSKPDTTKPRPTDPEPTKPAPTDPTKPEPTKPRPTDPTEPSCEPAPSVPSDGNGGGKPGNGGDIEVDDNDRVTRRTTTTTSKPSTTKPSTTRPSTTKPESTCEPAPEVEIDE